MARALVLLDRIVAALGGLLLLVLLVPVSVQVFARLVPDIETPMWTEEGARFVLVWMVRRVRRRPGCRPRTPGCRCP